MVRIRQPTIERAMALLDEEKTLVDAELEAFETFLGRLDDLGASSPDCARVDSGPTALATVDPAQSQDLRRIRQAYRETVMAVPHYDREYNDTLAESMGEEFGATLAGHVVDGQVLTPTIHGALLEAAEQARDDRKDFQRLLGRERDSLETVAAELNDIESRVLTLGDRIDETTESVRLGTIDETLARLERRCDDLVARRQETIHNRTSRPFSGIDAVSLAGYLYQEMETETPALADVAACLETIRYQRTRCLR